jgi:hypothetical protein
MTTKKVPEFNDIPLVDTGEISDSKFARIKRESEAARAREPHAESVAYDAASGSVKVSLRGGSVVVAKARELRGLADATDEQLTDVRVFDGTALFWDALDVQHSLIAFLGEALGISTAQNIGRRGGSARTEKKADASRSNGAKGGRPRKVVAAS